MSYITDFLECQHEIKVAKKGAKSNFDVGDSKTINHKYDERDDQDNQASKVLQCNVAPTW